MAFGRIDGLWVNRWLPIDGLWADRWLHTTSRSCSVLLKSFCRCSREGERERSPTCPFFSLRKLRRPRERDLRFHIEKLMIYKFSPMKPLLVCLLRELLHVFPSFLDCRSGSFRSVRLARCAALFRALLAETKIESGDVSTQKRNLCYL